MKVLLLGDYSGVHYNLFLGLCAFGVDVTLISSGDGKKEIPTNIRWRTQSSSRIARIMGVNGRGFIGLNSDLIKSLSGYDVVQIINPVIVEEASIRANRELFSKLRDLNGKVFLYSCGDDLNWVSACMVERNKRSMFKELGLYFSTEIVYPARYVLNPDVRSLCNYVYAEVDGIIPGSNDYNWCAKQSNKLRNIIPFPVDLNMFNFEPVTPKKKYKVLHGYQAGKSIRKGDQYFEKAMAVASQSFSYRKIGGLPFLEYISLLGDCDIFFDQVHSRDQGMNAIFAMASGKVTFSGFEKEFYEHYNLQWPVGVNAKPTVTGIADQISAIEMGEIDVEKLSYEARKFVENFHDHKKIAQLFLDEWLC